MTYNATYGSMNAVATECNTIYWRKGVNAVTNTELLREYISKSGLKLGYLADQCEITRQALSNKITNRHFFTAKEIEVLCRELKITSLIEKERIFFAKEVAS